MDDHSIQRIRNASFSSSVRGYDRAEVDRFLAELADWIETGIGGDAPAVEAVRIELERVGEQTASILTEAHAAGEAIREDAAQRARQQLADANLTAESLRGQAGEYAGETRDEANAFARRVRTEAEDHAETVRAQADAHAEEERNRAQKEAERIVAEANARRGEIEKVIGDLEQRRDAVLAELERLASGIAGTATEHRGPTRPDPGSDPSGDDDDAGDVTPRPAEITDGDADETSVLARNPD